jgi:hypothetical protein
MTFVSAAKNLVLPGARERATQDDVATLRDAVELNEQAVGKAATEAGSDVTVLSRDQIQGMSLDEIDRYFAGDSSPANEAVFEVTRLGDAAQANQFCHRCGVLALACGGAAVAFPPLAFGTVIFGGMAFLARVRANQHVLSSDAGHPAQRAQQTSLAVKESMARRLDDSPGQQAERAALLEQRRTLVSQLPSGAGLGQAFATEGDWLLGDVRGSNTETGDSRPTLDGTPPP